MIELDEMKLCPYCFRSLGDSDICSCRYARTNVSKDALPAGSVLGGRYIVGALLENFEDSLTKKYLCYDYQEKRKVLLKEFYPHELVNGRIGTALDISSNQKSLHFYNDCMQNYISKVRTAQAIECEYSLKVLNAFFENNTAYFVVEPHSLLTVREYAKNNNCISCEQAVKYLYQMLTFFSLTDRERYVHCGLKDTTVYIDEENDKIFIDGFEGSLGEVNTKTTTFYALNNYMHVKCGANPPSPVCDFFSAGAILYTLLTRKIPTSDIVCDDRFDLFAFEKIADEGLRELIKKMCCIGSYEYKEFSELVDDANSVFVRYGYKEIECFESEAEELKSISVVRRKNKIITAAIVAVLAVIIAVCGFAFTKHNRDEGVGEETTVSQTDITDAADTTDVADTTGAADDTDNADETDSSDEDENSKENKDSEETDETEETDKTEETGKTEDETTKQ